ncbi:MAG: FkbM family methyltransferase [Bacteroidota bacterium]
MPPHAPPAKRLMRALWRILPPSALSFNAGKLITRTLLRPEPGSCPVPILFAGRIPLTVDLGGFVPNDLYCLDVHYEATTMRLWRRLACTSSVILDVGSHIGTFALAAADANPHARILAVEADGDLFRALREHSGRFPNVEPVHAAVADTEGTMWFCPVGGNDGGGHLSATPPDRPGSYPVATHTLARICGAAGVGSVDLMKMDVEGLEHTLLTGDEEFFSRHAPEHIIVELTVDRRDRARTEVLFQAMRRRGYAAARIQGLYAFPFGRSSDLANWHFRRAGAPAVS